jgi:predicted alpha/beta superfamily hydrolase
MNPNRNRDMLPVNQADVFLEFIEKELMPVVEKSYQINNRILYGHSFAGCFTIFAMLNRPELFGKYIASSPTPIMNMVETSHYNQLDDGLNNEVQFYFSFGSKDMRQVRKWCNVLIENLKYSDFEFLKVKHNIFPGENHNSSDIISLNNGLKF